MIDPFGFPMIGGWPEIDAQGMQIGDLYLADISVPPDLYKRLSTPRVVPSFSVSDILRLPN